MAVANVKAQVDQMKAAAGNNLEYFMVQVKNRLEEVDRMIAAEEVDIRRRELYLQREALSHTITEANRKYALEVAGMRQAGTQGGGGKGKLSKPEGPMNLAGSDKAGTLTQDQYGAVPDSILENPA
jgi:hypothetical protein